MKKEELVWLCIRLMGLAFAAGAIYLAAEFFQNVLAVLVSIDSSVGGTIRLPNLRWDPAFRAILFGAISLYFLFRGKVVFALFVREGTPNGRI